MLEKFIRKDRNEILENGAYLYITDENKAKKDFIHYMYEI